jgi:hypothetical protein
MNLPVQAEPVQRGILVTSAPDREYSVQGTFAPSNGVVASQQGVTASDWTDVLKTGIQLLPTIASLF